MRVPFFNITSPRWSSPCTGMTVVIAKVSISMPYTAPYGLHPTVKNRLPSGVITLPWGLTSKANDLPVPVFVCIFTSTTLLGPHTPTKPLFKLMAQGETHEFCANGG